MSKRSVIGFGELLWDDFPAGQRLGGAPANVAYHAAALGDRAALLSRVGRDEEGDIALAELESRHVSTELVQRDDARPTGRARVKVREAEVEFLIDAKAAWTAPSWSEGWAAAAATADAIAFGALIAASPQGRAALERAAAAGSAAVRLLDLNLRPPLTPDVAIDAALACANALKVSEEEEAIVCRRLDVRDLGEWAIGRGFLALAVTRGARGCTVVTPLGRAEQPGRSIGASGGDPVGAGDAFTSALLHHLMRSADPGPASRAANRYAAFVASCPGAMPPVPPDIRAEVQFPGGDT